MGKKLNVKLYREDYYLLVILFMMAIGIAVKSYFHVDGYLSSDSTSYLGLAQNLLDGNGYFISAYGITEQNREYFAKWPIAYPTLIFIISKLTGLSVFWASKVLNVILIGVILGIFRFLFNKNAYVYGAILLFGAYIELFSYTWSETLFITALLWFASSIYFFMLNPKKTTMLYISMMMASLLLFMSRYIGAFSFGLIGLLGLYYGLIKKDKLKSAILIFIAIFNIMVMVFYLYHNYSETGYITGMLRVASWESNLELFNMLRNAVFSEILIITMSKAITIKSLLLLNFQIIIFTFLLWKYRNNILRSSRSNQEPISLSFMFTIISLVYLFFIILMRWMTQFDSYSFRLLSPGSFLLFIAVIFFLQEKATKKFFTIFKGILLFFAMLSFLFNVPYKVWESTTRNSIYFEGIETLEEKFAQIEQDSIVIFAPKHIKYLYPNIQIREPDSLPYSLNKESWSEFMRRMHLKNQKKIYLYIPEEKPSLKEFDQSVITVVNEYSVGTLVKLK